MRSDLYTLYSVVAALVIHGLLAGGIFLAPAYVRSGPKIVQFELKKPPPPPPKIVQPPPPPPKEEPPPPPPPPEPPKKVKREPKPPEPPKAPIPNETPKEPPKEPAKPVFGVSMSSTTTGDSSFAVPVGNTTITDPKNTGRPHDVRPLPPPPPASAPAPVFKPASPLEVKDYPEVDEASCTPPSRYFPEDLRDQGVEGETQLRVEISEAGKVMGVRVLGGPHKTLNDLAAQWMKTRCRFPKPARNTAGKPVPFVITYRFKWEIER